VGTGTGIALSMDVTFNRPQHLQPAKSVSERFHPIQESKKLSARDSGKKGEEDQALSHKPICMSYATIVIQTGEAAGEIN
jgi:hypothetical protein